jgi:hypothetical protein
MRYIAEMRPPVRSLHSRLTVIAGLASLVVLACSRPELAPPDPVKADAIDSGVGALTNAAANATHATHAEGERDECGHAKTTKTFGESIKGTDIVDVSSVLDDPDRFADKPVLVQGRVRAACTRKGCWMELAPSMEKDAPGSRVTFKDYGFFVPTTSMGKVACVEGIVSTKRVPPEEVRHIEGEGGRFAKKMSDGSAREVRIVATGVEMWDAT